MKSVDIAFQFDKSVITETNNTGIYLYDVFGGKLGWGLRVDLEQDYQ
jgi:hypothetical protein